MTTTAWIELRDVSKAYGQQAVLRNASLTVRCGEFVAAVGRSGSGKSTLLRLIGGLESADSGLVCVGGTDLNTLTESARALRRRRELGFVFQFFNLIPTLTVGENVELPLALNDVTAQEARQRSRQLLGELGLHDCADRFPEELSGGEQQRVAIARAVIHEPKLVLADEPTGNLDAETASQVLELLRHSCRERQATLVVATHSVEVAAQADRVISIRTGRIADESPPMRLLRRASLRFYLRHPWQLGIAITGIGLGVGVYVGVQLANDSAGRAFELSAALVRGQTSHRLLPIGPDLDEALYREVVIGHGIATAAPVIEAEVGIASRPGLRIPLLGIDPLQERGVRSFSSFVPASGNGALARLIAEPGTVLLPQALAAELGAGADTRLTLQVGGRDVDVTVLGTIPDLGADVAAEPPILADIATAQDLLGRPGHLSHIDLLLTEQQAQRLSDAHLPGTILVRADRQGGAFTELAAAFRTNLTALGLLALVVGTFLIYGTMSFAILRRRTMLGVLRAIGVSQRELVGSVLVEALGVALAATLLGLAFGHWLAVGLVELVLRTIGDLYFSAAVTATKPSPWIYLQGAALGIGATLLAATKPALDAARATPALVLRRSALERGVRRGAQWAALAAAVLLALSVLLLALGPNELYIGFGGLFAVLAAGALLTPAATMLLMRSIDLAFGRRLGLPTVLAVRGVSASLSRTGVATAALAVAIATVNGVGLMITSFRTSLSDWLDTTLTADLYVSFDGAERELANLALLHAIEGIDGVAGVSLARTVVVPTPGGEIAVRAVRPGARGWGLVLVDGEPGAAFAALADGRGVLASERLMFARKMTLGDVLTLPTPTGPQQIPIVGAFRDFNTGNYSVVLALERYQRDWRDFGLTGLGVDLTGTADAVAAEQALRDTLAGRGGARVRSSSGIERLSLEIFDRTFKITEVLRILAAVVAFLGILSALLAIELERTHELGVLRALGFSPRGLAATLLTQTGLLGLAAGLVAIPLGTGLAALLVHVINRRSFGWSMNFVMTPEPLVGGLLLAVAAALLAGVYPSWRSSRGELAATLREE